MHWGNKQHLDKIVDFESQKDAHNIYLIHVDYKNGNFHEFWCAEFEINKIREVKASWKAVFADNRPLFMNLDDVSSVWVKDMDVVTREEYNESPELFAGMKEFFEGEKD